MSSDYADFQTPQANATAISITGVPLLAAPDELYGLVGPSPIAAGQSGLLVANLGASTITDMGNYLSFDFTMQIACNAASLAPFATVTFSWFMDAAATILLYQDVWTMACTAAAGGNTMYGTGPCRSRYLVVSLANEDGVNGETIEFLYLAGNSRTCGTVYPDFRTSPPSAAIPTFNSIGGSLNFDGVIGRVASVNFAAGITRTYALGLYNGPITINVSLPAPPAGPDILVQPNTFFTGIGQDIVSQFFVVGTSADSISFTVQAPRSPVLLSVTNNGANGTHVQIVATAGIAI